MCNEGAFKGIGHKIYNVIIICPAESLANQIFATSFLQQAFSIFLLLNNRHVSEDPF